jgi:tyrosine-protein phosphatase SIW14
MNSLLSLIFSVLSLLCAHSLVCAQSTAVQRPSNWATKVEIGSLSNSFQVDSVLFRSEQPSKADMKALEVKGFRTVVNLRNVRKDNRKARGTNLALVHVPINTWRMSYEDVVLSLRAIHVAEKPVMLHCIHGSDRTGVVAAFYRMTAEGWAKDDAIKEFLEGGYGYHSGWFPNILHLMESIDPEKLKADVGR